MIKFIKKASWKFLPKILRNVLGLRNIILFKPHPCFSGNVHALYKYLADNGYGKRYKFIWCTSFDGEKVPEKATRFEAKTFKGKYYYKACAKYVFYEDECPTNKIMRGQKVIYLSHGCPTLKNSTGRVDVYESKTTDALITSNEVRGVLAKIRRFPENKMFVCGHPKNDIMFNEPLKYSDFLNCEYSKHILWMPTFRKTKPFANWELRNDNESIDYLYGLPLIHNESDLEMLNESLKSKNILLIIKPHPSALKEGIEKIKYSNIAVWTQEYLDKNEINLHRFFKDTSAFISDYSSVIFDAMLADKPLAYIIDDIDDYKLGFAYENVLDYMPGHHIKTLKDMISFFEDVSQNKDIYRDERHRVNTWANAYPDGNNCKRIIEMFGL